MSAIPNLPPVLAATDFSPAAEQAARRAAQGTHDLGAPLVLVHVHEAPVLGEAWRQLQAWMPGMSGAEAAALHRHGLACDLLLVRAP